MLAKAHATAGRKVCTVDLDFIGSGFEHLLDMPSPARFLDEYVTRDPGADDLPKLDEMLTRYRPGESDAGEIDFLLNLGGAQGNHDLASHFRATGLSGREPVQGIVARAVQRLLAELADTGYEVALLDCQPGLAYLSRSVLDLGKGPDAGEHFGVFVTTFNRAHFYGILGELNYLASSEAGGAFRPSRSVLCVNRAPEELGPDWEDLIDWVDRETVHPEEAMARAMTFQRVCEEAGGPNYVRIGECQEIADATRVGGRAQIEYPGPGRASRTDTQACRTVMASLGE